MNKLMSMAAAISLLTLASCGSMGAGNVSVDNGKDSEATVKKEIKISDFNEVSAMQGIKVIFTQGTNPGKAIVSTTPYAEQYLKVTVKDGELKAWYDAEGQKKTNVKIKGPTIIKISSPELKEVDLSSGANFKLNGDFTSNGQFEVELSSGSSFEAGSIRCGEFDAQVSSGASMKVKSVAGKLEVDVSSGSSASISQATNGNASVEASSGASVSISGMSSGNVLAKASSGGSVTLSGKATLFTKKTSSGGAVYSSGLKVSQQ